MSEDRRHVTETSTNPDAERLMGRRLTAGQETAGQPAPVPFDMPCELGFQCPVHRTPWDEGLEWSEYNGFLWCERCDRDYPSALCVPMEDSAGSSERWWNAGPEAAIRVFLETVSDAVRRAQ